MSDYPDTAYRPQNLRGFDGRLSPSGADRDQFAKALIPVIVRPRVS